MRASQMAWCVRCGGVLVAIAVLNSPFAGAKEPSSLTAVQAQSVPAGEAQPAEAASTPTKKPAAYKSAAAKAAAKAASAAEAKAAATVDGRELFMRQWLPHDERAHGGDGLGPAFNENSCAACHNMGGIGGAGGNNHNVDVLTARMTVTNAPPKEKEKATQEAKPVDAMGLISLHSGFGASNEFVLHKYGTDDRYAGFRKNLLKSANGSNGQPNVATDEKMRENMESVGIRTVEGPETVGTGSQNLLAVVSKRNTTSLFGVGLIDAISDEVLIKEEKQQRERNLAQAGRVSRLSSGKLGRFGWKSQAASLEEFTNMACAVEIGLTVPSRQQAALPTVKDIPNPSIDMAQTEVLALVSFMRNLPRPIQKIAATNQEAEYVGAGKTHFETIGCAFCHTPNLGSAQGLYSDLLLHDITPEVTRPYYGTSPGPSGSGTIDLADIGKIKLIQTVAKHGWSGTAINPLLLPAEQQAKLIGSLGPEWRTPPLWGVRDSGPYLHDGQAETLEQAIALHGGQAKQSSLAFFKLKSDEQQQLLAFLKSLTAPDMTAAVAAR